VLIGQYQGLDRPPSWTGVDCIPSIWGSAQADPARGKKERNTRDYALLATGRERKKNIGSDRKMVDSSNHNEDVVGMRK
jgi:hypothetical protein